MLSVATTAQSTQAKVDEAAEKAQAEAIANGADKDDAKLMESIKAQAEEKAGVEFMAKSSELMLEVPYERTSATTLSRLSAVSAGLSSRHSATKKSRRKGRGSVHHWRAVPQVAKVKEGWSGRISERLLL